MKAVFNVLRSIYHRCLKKDLNTRLLLQKLFLINQHPLDIGR